MGECVNTQGSKTLLAAAASTAAAEVVVDVVVVVVVEIVEEVVVVAAVVVVAVVADVLPMYVEGFMNFATVPIILLPIPPLAFADFLSSSLL